MKYLLKIYDQEGIIRGRKKLMDFKYIVLNKNTLTTVVIKRINNLINITSDFPELELKPMLNILGTCFDSTVPTETCTISSVEETPGLLEIFVNGDFLCSHTPGFFPEELLNTWIQQDILENVYHNLWCSYGGRI